MVEEEEDLEEVYVIIFKLKKDANLEINVIIVIQKVNHQIIQHSEEVVEEEDNIKLMMHQIKEDLVVLKCVITKRNQTVTNLIALINIFLKILW